MEHEEPYLVVGTTAQELRRSINSNRGQDYDAVTGWDIQWRVTSCATSTWSVSLDVGYRLPKWDPPANADPVLVAQWQRYDAALRCHEYGHAKLGLECAHRVYDTLSALPGSSDCAALSKSATAAFNQILSECHTAEVNYDTVTQHGATMGATFPP